MSNEVGELVSLLTTGLHHAQLYLPDHPRVRECAETFARRVGESASRTPNGTFFVGVVDGRLVHDGRVLLGPTLTAKRLLDAAAKLHCGGFAFRHGVEASEIRGFFTACSKLRTGLASSAEGRALLQSHGVTGVELAPSGGGRGGGGAGGGGGGSGGGSDDPSAGELSAADLESLTAAVPEYQSLLERVELSHAASGAGHEIDTAASRGTFEQLLPGLTERPADLLSLSRYPDFDSYTVGHSVRVSLLSVIVGSRLGFPEPVLIELGAAGLLHDVGKGRIPESILMKQGPLSDDERNVMKTHPTLGAEVLLASKDAPAFAVAAAWGHHLRHDRKGYPASAPWARRSRITALVQVCDVFEALTAVRPYKASFTPRKALGIMLEDRAAYDPSAFAAFVSAIGFYPPGSRVRLTSGDEALVLRAGAHPARPVVEVQRTAGGRLVPPAERAPADLGVPGAPGVEDFAEEDLLSTLPSEVPEAELPPRSAHQIIEDAGACPGEDPLPA